MLGNFLCEGKSKLTGSRILNPDEYNLEHSLIEANFKDKDIEIPEMATYWTICLDKNLTYVEGQRILCTKVREDTTKFRGYEIHRSKGQVSGIFCGPYTSHSANVKFSFPNNNVEVFETLDESRTSIKKRGGWR